MPHAKAAIRPLKKSDRKAFCQMMALAFQHDPLFVQVFPEAKARVRQLRSLLGLIFDKATLFDEVLMGYVLDDGVSDDGLKAAYVLQTPRPVTLWQNLRLALWGSRLLVQLPWSSLKLLNDYMRLITALRPNNSHYYLNIIGVNPRVQGQGICKAMLEHILNIVDTDAHACCIQLDTTNPNNPAFYKHFGFWSVTARDLQGVKLYFLLRNRAA